MPLDFAATRSLLALACAIAAPWPAAAQQGAAPPPNLDHRRLIADNLSSLFSADAHARNVMVSELRRVPSTLGLAWAACVRVSATGMGGQPIPPRTYLVTFTSRNTIAERNAATGEQCAGAKFEPVR